MSKTTLRVSRTLAVASIWVTLPGRAVIVVGLCPGSRATIFNENDDRTCASSC
jgi:hypothetical protein